MKVSTLSLRFDAEAGGFDNTALDAFQQTRDLLSMVEHFFVHDGQPWLLLVLTWKPHRHLEPKPPRAKDGPGMPWLRSIGALLGGVARLKRGA